MVEKRTNAPLISGLIAVFLAITKLIAGLMSGSMSVLSSAIDSMMDSLVSAINFFAIKKASDDPNSKFNYGFGKIEALMALGEGIFIILIGNFIFYSSIQKLITPEVDINFGIAFWVMVFSFVMTGGLIIYLNSMAKKTNSLIIKADALHYKSDFFTNFGIIIALLVIKFTGFVMIDAIIGILISIYIIYSAIKLAKEGVYVLLDGALDDEIVRDIISYIDNHEEVRSFHFLRTRKSGDTCFFSTHLVFNPNITLYNAHSVGDDIESYVSQKYSGYNWVIDLHFDPTDDSKESK